MSSYISRAKELKTWIYYTIFHLDDYFGEHSYWHLVDKWLLNIKELESIESKWTKVMTALMKGSKANPVVYTTEEYNKLYSI